MRLEPVAPNNLHDHWDSVEEDLRGCLKHDTSGAWIEDVYAMIRNGAAFLYIGRGNNDEHMGALVIERTVNRWNGDVGIHVWMCCNRAGHQILREGQGLLEEIALQAGAKKITFRSDKLSFERLCRDLGYQLSEIELVKELN